MEILKPQYAHHHSQYLSSGIKNETTSISNFTVYTECVKCDALSAGLFVFVIVRLLRTLGLLIWIDEQFHVT